MRRQPWLSALLEQVRSPLTGILAAGAALSLILGARGDVVINGVTIIANVAVGVWQEHKANRVSQAGGGLVILAGFLRNRPPGTLISTGATLALTAIPEGLPLLSRVSEAGVARRLASRNAAVRRLSAVEALGRVDVVCTDKTGTMTEGHLTLSLIADSEQEARLPGEVPAHLRSVLLTGALASPHPDAPGATTHPTDVAVIQSAMDIGLGEQLQVQQTADVVLADDDFSSLVEAFVEGRSFWRNIRRALGLLLGGNLGELGLGVGASLLGLNFPLTASQILTMNAITDILPATAVALQQPEHRSLAGLDREGARALDKPLRNDIVRRGLSTALPSLIAYFIMLGSSTLPQARSVAYTSVIVAQLAQTLDAGRYEGGLTPPVLGAVGGSLAVLLGTFTVPPVRDFLSLVMPTPFGWALGGGGAIMAVVMSRVLASPLFARPAIPQLVAAPAERVALAQV